MNNNYRKIQYRILLLFSIVIFLLTFFLTIIPYRRSVNAVQRHVSELLSAGGRQLRANIDSHFAWIEKTANLMFSDPEIYAYDKSMTNKDRYTQLQIEEKITDRIEELSLMDNYADFGIVYANDEVVGWISEIMKAQYLSGGMYDEFAETLTNTKEQSGWSYGHRGNYEKLYYTKRINQNAILIMSFYVQELEGLFELSDEYTDDVSEVLVDGDNVILFSHDTHDIGTVLKEEISTLAAADYDSSVVGEKYMVTTAKCMNGWRIICSEPVDTIMEETTNFQRGTVLLAVISSMLFLGLTQFLFFRLTRPVEGIMSDLNKKASYDQLTDVLNKNTFKSKVSKCINDTMVTGALYCFVMIDMDNFKQINDNLGHNSGDDVIARLGKILKKSVESDMDRYAGRIGGDEFAIFICFPNKSAVSAERAIKDYVDQVLYAFNEEFETEHRNYGLSMSIGVIMTNSRMNYDEMYRFADDAMYQSKRTGKNRVTYVKKNWEESSI